MEKPSSASIFSSMVRTAVCVVIVAYMPVAAAAKDKPKSCESDSDCGSDGFVCKEKTCAPWEWDSKSLGSRISKKLNSLAKSCLPGIGFNDVPQEFKSLALVDPNYEAIDVFGGDSSIQALFRHVFIGNTVAEQEDELRSKAATQNTRLMLPFNLDLSDPKTIATTLVDKDRSNVFLSENCTSAIGGSLKVAASFGQYGDVSSAFKASRENAESLSAFEGEFTSPLRDGLDEDNLPDGIGSRLVVWDYYSNNKAMAQRQATEKPIAYVTAFQGLMMYHQKHSGSSVQLKADSHAAFNFFVSAEAQASADVKTSASLDVDEKQVYVVKSPDGVGKTWQIRLFTKNLPTPVELQGWFNGRYAVVVTKQDDVMLPNLPYAFEVKVPGLPPSKCSTSKFRVEGVDQVDPTKIDKRYTFSKGDELASTSPCVFKLVFTPDRVSFAAKDLTVPQPIDVNLVYASPVASNDGELRIKFNIAFQVSKLRDLYVEPIVGRVQAEQSAAGDLKWTIPLGIVDVRHQRDPATPITATYARKDPQCSNNVEGITIDALDVAANGVGATLPLRYPKPAGKELKTIDTPCQVTYLLSWGVKDITSKGEVNMGGPTKSYSQEVTTKLTDFSVSPQ